MRSPVRRGERKQTKNIKRCHDPDTTVGNQKPGKHIAELFTQNTMKHNIEQYFEAVLSITREAGKVS